MCTIAKYGNVWQAMAKFSMYLVLPNSKLYSFVKILQISGYKVVFITALVVIVFQFDEWTIWSLNI